MKHLRLLLRISATLGLSYLMAPASIRACQDGLDLSPWIDCICYDSSSGGNSCSVSSNGSCLFDGFCDKQDPVPIDQ